VFYNVLLRENLILYHSFYTKTSQKVDKLLFSNVDQKKIFERICDQ